MPQPKKSQPVRVGFFRVWLGDLERCPETRMNAHFGQLSFDFVPRFVPRFGLCYPSFSGHHRSIRTRPKPSHKKTGCLIHAPGEGHRTRERTRPGFSWANTTDQTPMQQAGPYNPLRRFGKLGNHQGSNHPYLDPSGVPLKGGVWAVIHHAADQHTSRSDRGTNSVFSCAASPNPTNCNGNNGNNGNTA